MWQDRSTDCDGKGDAVRCHAYVMLADPSFLEASLASYYDQVSKIVLSFDETSTSWTGTPIEVARCLELVRRVDTQHKCVELPGLWAQINPNPMDTETAQRQAALDVASVGADWVLQLDTDEVVMSPESFFGSLRRADDAAAEALEFPSRWLYSRVGRGRYLEASSRFWRPVAGYPGPLAVRAGTRLTHARQCDVPLYRVDLRPWNTDPSHPREAVVHEVVAPEDAVVHFSWVRSEQLMRRRFGWSGHSADLTDPTLYQRWVARSRRPMLTAATSPFRGPGQRFRLVQIPEPPGGEP